MEPVVLRLFASQILASASGPGQGSSSLVLSGVRGPNTVTEGPNDRLFDKPSEGNIQFNANGVTDSFVALFSKGKKYKLTLEEDNEVAQTAPPA